MHLPGIARKSASSGTAFDLSNGGVEELPDQQGGESPFVLGCIRGLAFAGLALVAPAAISILEVF
jgi:hypothetical protein